MDSLTLALSKVAIKKKKLAIPEWITIMACCLMDFFRKTNHEPGSFAILWQTINWHFRNLNFKLILPKDFPHQSPILWLESQFIVISKRYLAGNL